MYSKSPDPLPPRRVWLRETITSHGHIEFTRTEQNNSMNSQRVIAGRDLENSLLKGEADFISSTLLYKPTIIIVSSLIPRHSVGRGQRTPGTHCLRMRLISEISRKIGYFSNPDPPCNNDV